MPTITVPWLSDKALKVSAKLSDVKAYEQSEKEALATGTTSAVLEARLAFLERVVSNANPGATITAEATVDQIQAAWLQAWRAIMRPEEVDDPLG